MNESLWLQVQTATARAEQSDALVTLATEHQFIEDKSLRAHSNKEKRVRFIVRIAPPQALRDKDASSHQAHQDPQQSNPFLPPYDPALFVADLSPTHVCLLNKYNVFPNHILVVTRAYESQEAWLTPADFAALWTCMREIDGLAFYNAGSAAGASQPHKHLQLVPFPLAPAGPTLPIAPLLEASRLQDQIGIVPAFLFIHAIAALDLTPASDETLTGQCLFQTYCDLLNATGLIEGTSLTGTMQRAPYNLLVTREWMWLVPRSAHKFEGIQINSLGYAGAFLVRDRTHLQVLQTHSPLQVLAATATPLTNRAM